MTKAKMALEEIHDGIATKDVKWVRRRFEIVYKALKLLDKVESGGVDLEKTNILYEYNYPDNWAELIDEIGYKYILIERE